MSALGFKRVVAITTSIMLLLLQATPAEGLVNTNAFSDGNDSHPVLTKSVNDQENDTVDEQKKLSGAKTLADTIGFQMNNAAASAVSVPMPTVTATEPTTDGEVKLSGSVTAGYWVYYSFDGKTFMLADSTTSDETWSKVVTLPRSGNNTIYVYSKKSNYQSGTATINVAFTVPKPTVSATEPTTDGEVKLSGFVTAGYWVYYSFDGKTFMLADSTTSDETWSKVVTLPRSGNNTIYVYSKKSNYQSGTATINVAFTVPKPTVSATEPTTDGEVKLSGFVTAGYWVYYSFDGKTFMLADSTTSDGTWSKVVTLPRIGNNTIYVYSKKSNFRSETATINVAFTVPKPTVSVTEPTTDGEVTLSGSVTAGYWVYYSFDGKTFMLADSTTSDGTWSKVVTLPRIGNNTIYVYSKKSNFRSETATINVAFTVPKPTVSVTEPTTDGEVTLSGSVTAGYWVYYSFDGKTFTLADSTTSHGTWSKEVALPKTGAVVVYIYAQKAKYQSEVVRLDVSLVSPEMLARAQAILGPDVLTGRKTNSKTPEYLFYDKNGNLVGRLLQPVRTESQDEWYNALGQLVAEIKKDGSKRLYSYQGKNLSAVVSFDVKGSMEWRQQYYYGTDNETLLYSARNYPDGNVDYYNPQGALYAEALLARQAFSRELYSVIQNELGRVQPGGYFAGTSYEAFVSEMMSAQAVAALKRLISVAMRADSASFISLLNSPKHLILRPLQEHPFWDSVKDSWIFSGAGIAFGDANDNVVIFYCDLAALNSPAGDASAKSAVPVLAHELKHIGDFSAGYDRPHTEWRAYQVQTDWMRRMGFPIRDINRQQWLTDRIPDRDFAGPAARLATGEFSKDINPKTGIAYTYPEAEAEVMAPLNSAEQFLAAKFPGSSSGLEYLSSLSSSKPRYGETIEGYDFVFRANGQQHSVFVDMSGEWIFYNGEWQIDAARMAARLLDRNGISREQYAAMIDWDARVTAGFVRLPATYSDFINAGYASQQLTDLAKVLNEAFSLDAVDFAEKYHSIQHIIFSSYSTEHGAGHFYPSSGSIILNNAAYPPGDPAYVWAYLLPLIFHEATHLRDFNGNIYPGPMDFRHSEARAYAENAHWEELFHRIFVYPWNSYNRSRFIAEHIPDNNYDGIVARAVTSDTAVSEQAFAPLETAQQFLQPSANGAVDLKYISSSLGQRDLYGAPVQGYDFVFESNDQQYNVFVDMSGEWIYDGEWQIDAARMAARLLDRSSITRQEYENMRTTIWGGTKTYEQFVAEGSSPAQAALLKQVLNLSFQLDGVNIHEKLTHIKHFIWGAFGGQGKSDPVSGTVLSDLRITDINKLVMLLAHEAVHVKDLQKITSPAMRDYMDSEVRAYREDAHWMELLGYPVDGANQTRFIADHIADNNYEGVVGRVVRDPANEALFAQALRPEFSAQNFFQNRTGQSAKYLFSVLATAPGTTVSGYDFVFEVNGQQHSVFVDMNGEWIFYNGQWQIDAARMAARLLDRNGISAAEYTGMLSLDQTLRGGSPLPSSYEIFSSQTLDPKMAEGLAAALNEAWALGPKRFLETIQSVQHILFFPYDSQRYGTGQGYPLDGAMVINSSYYASLQEDYKAMFLAGVIFHEAIHLRDFRNKPSPALRDLRVSERNAYEETGYWDLLFGNTTMFAIDQFLAEHIDDNDYNGDVAAAVTNNAALFSQVISPVLTAVRFLEDSRGFPSPIYLSSVTAQKSRNGTLRQGYDFIFRVQDKQYNLFVDLNGQWIFYNGQWYPAV